MGKKYTIIGVLLGFVGVFYAFAPEERISNIHAVFRRMINEPGQMCFDYIANNLNDPRSAYLVDSNHIDSRVQITYRAKNLVGACVLGKYTCRLAADGSIDSLLTETTEFIEKTQQWLESVKDK